MSQPSLSGMTLRQKLIEADKLARELADHLERGYLPRLQKLRRMTRHAAEADSEETSDISVRTSVEQIIQSDDFARGLTARLDQLMTSIEAEAREVTG